MDDSPPWDIVLTDLEATVRVLKKLEWQANLVGPEIVCLCCGQLTAQGHHEDCFLSALIADLTEELSNRQKICGLPIPHKLKKYLH